MSEPTGNNPDAQAKAAEYQKMQAQAGQSPKTEAENASQEGAPSASEADAPDVTEQVIDSGDELTTLKAELEQAKAEAEKNKEAMLRMAAEAENTRRRAAEEVSKAHKFAVEGFAEALLPVKDSLEAALALENQTIENLLEGVAATLRQLESAFERSKVQVLDPKGEKFDPNLHQAVSMVPGNSVEPPVPANHVVSVLQKGYLINERVLRPALVAVAQ